MRRLTVTLANSHLHWSRHATPRDTGALVLAGSSGRIDVARAELLAGRGVTALALRWFGGEGQRPTPCEIPLETFVDAIDLLAAECDRVVLIGLSYGAEAALLTATVDPRVDAVVALAPTDVAWEGQYTDDDDPRRSKWTWGGLDVPFVPFDRAWQPSSEPPALVDFYQRSRDVAEREVIEAAVIPVEKFHGDLVVVSGGDDQVWPSSRAAQRIVARRERVGLTTVNVEDADAGHPVALPGEPQTDPSRSYLVGGDADGPRRLGALAWPAIEYVLANRNGGRPDPATLGAVDSPRDS